MTTINAKFIEQLELIEPDLKDTEADFKWASSSVKKDQFRIDKNNASKIVLRVGRAMLAIKNTKQNLELYKDALKNAHRTFPAGAYKRGGMGRKYPKFSSGMTTAEYCIKFQALNNDVGAHVLPIDFDALGDRPAALYENGALDFDVIDEPIEAIEAIEAIAAKGVAEVVAQAVAAIAIDEAMQPSEAPILSTLDQFLAAQKEKMTCIRYAQTSRVMHSRVRYDEEVMKAHSWIELLIQSEGRKTTNKQENKLQDMTRLQSHRANNEEQQAHEKRVKLAGTKTVYYAQNEAGSMVELSFTEYLYAQFLEAMQPSEALELGTCEAGEGEAQAQSIGNTTSHTPAWAPMAEYVPCSPLKTGFEDAQKQTFSGGVDGEIDQNSPDTPPVESTDAPTPPPAEFFGEFKSAIESAYENRLPTTFERIKVGECFQFSKSGEVYIKCRGGYRPSRGGALIQKPNGYIVWFYDPASSMTAQEHKDAGIRTHSEVSPTPPAVESQQVAMAPSVETEAHQAQDATIAHQINESGAWTGERCESALSAQVRPTVQSKSGKWCAWLFINGLGLYGMGFEAIGSGMNGISSYPTASDRMKALQALARAADAPGDTPTDGQKRTESAEITPTPPPAVSSAVSAPPPAVSSGHPRNIIPANGLHIVDDAFEAWTFPHKDRFGFVMYLGKSAKPWKYYGYQTEAKRDAGFERCATEARDIAASKAKTKAETKARIDAGHGLQVGDVVRSSWGYDQTNVSHYQIVNVIGKRTVEVRKLAEHDDSTSSMSGRCSPVWGEFTGDVKRCMVDQFGNVNVMGRDFGRASKIEPIAMVHGVRCYAATYYSSYA